MFRIAGITSKGFEVLAEALSGKTLSFTRMEYGSGILPGLENIVADSETLEKYKEFIKENPEPTEQQILEMLRTEATDLETKTLILDAESLVSKKGDIGLYEAVSDNGITTLTGKVVDSSVSVDFRARELGVYAQVEEGEEVLFAYFSAVDFLSGEIRDSSDFISIPALLGQEQVIKVNIATGQAANITMKYNLEIYVSKKEFDETVAKIKNQIAIEVSNIIAEAPESFDTLKEISDWITEHAGSAAEMNTKIIQNQNDIKALQSLVGNIAGCVPVGTILQGLYAAAPTGFLLCNGQEVAIENFPKLYAVIGTLEECQSENEGMFKVPDLRECVMVGSGQSTRAILDENGHSHDVYALGEFKDDQLQMHRHELAVRKSGEGVSNGYAYSGLGACNATMQDTSYSYNGYYGMEKSYMRNIDGLVGSTTHGKQIGVNYIIKY